MKWEQINITEDEIVFNQSMQSLRESIIGVFGIPSVLIGGDTVEGSISSVPELLPAPEDDKKK